MCVRLDVHCTSIMTIIGNTEGNRPQESCGEREKLLQISFENSTRCTKTHIHR